MCTLTIFRVSDELTITMNRDDTPARAEAPPRIWDDETCRFAAPVDLEAGGTWIGVNAAGVAACLLNRYDQAQKGARSRGEIVPHVLRGQDLAAATLTLGQYSPFTCLIVSPNGVLRYDWNGKESTKRQLDVDAPRMFTSSSWRFEAVTAWRQTLFDATLTLTHVQPTALSEFHCALRPGEEAWAPMMRRDYAHTKSVTQIAIGHDAIELRYWPREHALARGLSRPSHVLTLAGEAVT